MRTRIFIFHIIIFTIFTSVFMSACSSKTDQTSINYINDFEPINEDGTISMVVEIPAGTNEKWEVTKPEGVFDLEIRNGKPRVINYLGYPGNYGMIPRTLLAKEAGGDGDPLDILAIGAPAKRGDVIKVKVIGILKFLDRGEQDDKLLAIMQGTALYSINNFDELNNQYPGISEIVKNWFKNYKGPGKMEFQGFGTAAEANSILQLAIASYSKH